MNLIEPAAPAIHPAEAIDPASDFWWIDDDGTEYDRDWLRAHYREDEDEAAASATCVTEGGKPVALPGGSGRRGRTSRIPTTTLKLAR